MTSVFSTSGRDWALFQAFGTLPDPWIVLSRDHFGRLGLAIDTILVHPGLGIAVVDEVPGDGRAGVAALSALLQRERFADFFPGTLPMVALSLAADAAAPCAAEPRVRAAFAAAPPLAIRDPDWVEAILALLSPPTEGPPVPPAAGEEEGEDARRVAFRSAGESERPPVWRGRRPLALAAAAALVATLGALATWQLAFSESSAAGARKRDAPRLAPGASVELALPPPPSVALEGASMPPAWSAPPAAGTPHASVAAARRKQTASTQRKAPRQVLCADWFHPSRPGGVDYRGPPVPECERKR